MDLEFKSLTELYLRMKPALRTKKRELYRGGYKYIKEEDIWNYLKETSWKSACDLALYKMVSDVLNINALELDEYMKKTYFKKVNNEYNI
jgi:hypothetical protein